MKNLNWRLILITLWAITSLPFLSNMAQAQGVIGIIAAENAIELPGASENPEENTNGTQDQDLSPSAAAIEAATSPQAIVPINELPLEDSSLYTLGVNDVIEISVMRHPEVSGQFMINNEGKIQYQFVGDLLIVGLTKDEVKNKIIELLTKYIISPEVLVKIVGYNSKVVYIIGEVGAPGKIFMRGDTITVREALMQSGLPTLGSSTRKCRLITPADEGKASIKYVDVFKLLYEGDLRENLVMKSGDTLYIPATVLTKAMRLISPVTTPVGNVMGTARTVAPAAAF